MTTLDLADGRVIELGERTAGGSKNETRFGRMPDGTDVVVKVQRNHGRLRDEAAALRFLASRPVRVPRVVVSTADRSGAEILILSLEPGGRARSPEGWQRFGRDLARLVSVDSTGWPLARIGAPEFAADHLDRLRLVAPLLAESTRDAVTSAIAQVAHTGRAVVTHGDPGSGNYLDVADQASGVLLDWETATVAPFGLDIGRASFIGLLDLGRTGAPRQLVEALVLGYRSALAAEIQLDDATLRAWTIIGGLQFIHTRLVSPLVPERTPQAAVEVLERFLA